MKTPQSSESLLIGLGDVLHLAIFNQLAKCREQNNSYTYVPH